MALPPGPAYDRSMAIIRITHVLVVALLAVALAACGDQSTAPEISTAADGEVVAKLTDKSGDQWTVTLPEGASEAYDLYGNDGRDPIGIWTKGPITAKADTRFAIGLPVNGGTGYVWRATGGSTAGSVAQLLEQGINPNDPGESVPGGSATHYFVYRATAAGTGTLEFGLYPPGADAPERTETFDVTVTQ